ncbi:MAG: hypothetical protein K1Y01_13050 [Vicinamibacteria bacterium]|nr:hypothetical protein [Vicinamibacteria bacterium]
MNLKQATLPLAFIALGLGAPFPVSAQDDPRGQNRQNESRGGRVDRAGDDDDRAVARRPAADRPARADRQEQGDRDRGASRSERTDRNDRNDRGDRYGRNDRNDRSDRNDRGERYDRRYDRRDDWGNAYRGDWSRRYDGYSRGYYAPRPLPRAYTPRRYYGPRDRLTLYFGWGSGYRYGSYYTGRVYGYRSGITSYGRYVSYGDLRLRDFPRDAEVYVDGYYAGVVDDFDGFFQRLTLEVGPHEIEVADRRYGSQFFDVYVDPYNTIDVHAERYR